jgi:hypothetical protein
LICNHTLVRDIWDNSQYQANITQFAEWLLSSSSTASIPRYGAWYINGTSLITGTAYGREHYTIMVNTSARHALPTMVNWLNTARLQMLASSSSLPLIRVTQAPLPASGNMQVIMQASSSLMIGIAFAFLPASVVGWIVKERQTKVKHLQMISGVSASAYWVSTFIWDFVIFMVHTAQP